MRKQLTGDQKPFVQPIAKTEKLRDNGAAAVQRTLRLALQIDPAKTKDPIAREEWYTATCLWSALDLYQKASDRVDACNFAGARAIAQASADYWAHKAEQFGERLLQLDASRTASAAKSAGHT